MISSVRKVIMDSKVGYTSTPRNQWVLSWPGQVVLCVSSMFWTTEVVEAMGEPGGHGLQVMFIGYGKCSKVSNTFPLSVLNQNVGQQGWNSQNLR